MATISCFEDLEIWKLARKQCREIRAQFMLSNFCQDWELKNQINRSSGSVMDNIAEGFERTGNREFIHFLIIAKASNGEVRSQLYRAKDRDYLDEQKFEELKTNCLHLSQQITGFIKYLKESDYKGFRYK